MSQNIKSELNSTYIGGLVQLFGLLGQDPGLVGRARLLQLADFRLERGESRLLIFQLLKESVGGIEGPIQIIGVHLVQLAQAALRFAEGLDNVRLFAQQILPADGSAIFQKLRRKKRTGKDSLYTFA